MTALYLLPQNPLTKYYWDGVQAYMEPLFEQRWQLFAPEPALNSMKYWYRCGDSKGSELPWLDPEKPILRGHHRWRMTSQGKLLYIYSGLAREFYNSYVKLANERCSQQDQSDPQKCLPLVQDELRKATYYQSALELARRACRKHLDSAVLHDLFWVQFQAVKIYPRQFSERSQELTFARMEYLPSKKEDAFSDVKGWAEYVEGRQ